MPDLGTSTDSTAAPGTAGNDTTVVYFVLHPIHGVGDNIFLRYGDIWHFVLNMSDIVFVIEVHIIFTFGANIDDGRDLMIQNKLVITGICGGPTKPNRRCDLVEPRLIHNLFICKTDRRI